MVIAREFLDLKQSPLQAAAGWLRSRHTHGSAVDMRQLTVVVPGGRAGRRLLEILVHDCDSAGLFLTPPAIETVGKLPELLYQPRRPFASDLTQRLVWAEVLRSATSAQLSPVFPRAPQDRDSSQWLDLAELLKQQHIELAGDGLDFADVAKLGSELGGPSEQRRWKSLAQLQRAYLNRLDSLELWDRQTARLVAIEKHECRTETDIVLIGAVDINVAMRNMLRQVADRVTSLIFASSDLRNHFDDYGCLVPEVWSNAELPIDSDRVLVVDSPADQADAVVMRLAELGGKYPADDIVVGIPDETLIPHIQRAVANAGSEARWGAGVPRGHSTPARLLNAVTNCLEQNPFAHIASLLRHCDIEQWLERFKIGGKVLEQLDLYHCEHLPFQFQGQWLGRAEDQGALRAAWEQITKLLEPLQQPPRKLVEWREPILDVLSEVYGNRSFDRTQPADRLLLAACESIRGALDDHAHVPDAIMPIVSASEALRWVFQEISTETVAALPNPEAIELLGWLELSLDDAPVLIVTGMNEGFVPQSVNSDVFLPNSLRRRLGMFDNDRRYARDAFATTVLARTKESVHWILGRRNQDGDPLKPSRLLFAVDGKSAAHRALKFFSPPSPPRRTSTDPRSETSLPVPRPKPLKRPITRLHVTSFRDYLACPYRFYLRHVLALDELDDSAREMDGRLFGNAAHSVLSQFGVSAIRDSMNAEEIQLFLDQMLAEYVARQFGFHPLPAVHVQVEQLRLRFRQFAAVQAERAKQGWRIEVAETDSTEAQAAEFHVDGNKPFLLRGRIDRIDRHLDTGERIIWDYKTSDTVTQPEKAHRCGAEWIDLQLPLYRHLARSLGITGEMKFGYILLPRDIRQTDFSIAPWTSQDLDEADEVARTVIRDVWAERFWPPAETPPKFSETFAKICQDDALGGMDDEPVLTADNS